MIARMLSQRRNPMRLANQLKLSAILIALIFSGCASLQPRLGFEELSTSGRPAESGSRDGLPQKVPVELSGSMEKGNTEFNFKFPLFVW
jgi:hypothetical protein